MIQQIALVPDPVSGFFSEIIAGIGVEALILTAMIAVTGVIVNKISNIIIERGIRRRGGDLHAAKTAKRVSAYIIYPLTFVFILGALGVPLTGLGAAVGLIGLGLSFALQDTISNFISGIMILVNRPFKIGDQIEIHGEAGTVRDIKIRATDIKTYDGRKVIVPNADLYNGVVINNTAYSKRRFDEEIRWKEISYIPQSSMNSLDPLQRVREQAVEIAEQHTALDREESIDRFTEMLEIVGIPPTRINDYPHQFSGGMQQRVIIALSLFLDPKLVIADEPTTALDVIMQDQVFKYLDRIQLELKTSMLIITHDISIVFESCDNMGVMHGGQLAETGSVIDIFDRPKHPYSILLQQAFPDLRFPHAELGIIEGSPPLNFGEVTQCTFAERCPLATGECRESAPPLEPVNGEHAVACFHSDEAGGLIKP
jgi:oligopeptide/dipeptide ABC transporter ATP-binding protein